MTRTELNIGVLGCGQVAQAAHLESCTKARNARLFSICDVADDLRERMAWTHAPDKSFADYDEMLADPDLDAVIVATPDAFHVPASIQALEAGKHVLCEKPLATSAAAAQRCVSRAEERQLVLAVGMIRRFHWNSDLMRFLATSGFIGHPERFEFTDGQAHGWPSATPFYFNKDLAGGGIFMTMGVHVIDSLLTCFDDLEVVTYSDDNFGGVEADDGLGDCGVDVLDGLEDALAQVAALVAVTELDGFVLAGGRAGGDYGLACAFVFQNDGGFDRRVSAGIEDFSTDYVDDCCRHWCIT